MAERSSAPRTVTVDLDAARARAPRRIPGPWWMLAGVGAVAVLAAGWIMLGGAATIGWLTAPGADFAPIPRLATQWLALAHGVPAVLPPITVSIVPLGVTGVLIVLSLPIASLAARQAAAQTGQPDRSGRVVAKAEPIVARVGLTFAGVYATVLTLVTTTVLGTDTGWQALLGGLAVGGLSGVWGAARGVGYRPSARLPRGARSLPRAVRLASLAVLGGAALALTVALWRGRDQVAALTDALGGGAAAAVVLIIVQLVYLPNLLFWSASWILGAGVRLGEDTMLTLSSSDVGFLPSLPVFGIVPDEVGALAWAWPAFGILAGAVAAAVLVLDRPRAHPAETTLVGTIAGLLSSVGVLLAGAVSGGGLGDGRMAWLGPDLEGLLLFAPALLGLSGALTGLAIGLWLRPLAPAPSAQPASEDERGEQAEPIEDPEEPAPDTETEGEPEPAAAGADEGGSDEDGSDDL